MRGQAAIEYLMTWGWMIVVIAVVSAALYSLGVFNPSTWIQKSARGFSSFSVEDWSLKSSGSLFVVLRSSLDFAVNVTNVTASLPSGEGFNSTPFEIYPGETYTAVIPVPRTQPGSFAEVDLRIFFTNPVSGIEHADTGTLYGPAE